MKRQQNIKIPQWGQLVQQAIKQRQTECPKKSFRSKLFEKRAVQPIPKVNDKEIILHSPQYEKYLQNQFKLSDEEKNPQIWGCILPSPRRTQSLRKNYLKRDINTPKNLFRTYVQRKSRRIFGIPLIKQFTDSDQVRQQMGSLSNNPESKVSQYFKKITGLDAEEINKANRYEDEKHEQIETSKFFLTKPDSSEKKKQQRYSSKFGELFSKQQGRKAMSQQIQRSTNKSIYKMSLQELRQSVKWKKHFLDCLSQSVNEVKSKYRI